MPYAIRDKINDIDVFHLNNFLPFSNIHNTLLVVSNFILSDAIIKMTIELPVRFIFDLLNWR